MAILFSQKVFSDVINDKNFTWFSDPTLNELLGSAEKFFVEAKVSNRIDDAGTLTVTLELSNDNVNWLPMDDPTIDQLIDASHTVVFASDFAGGNPVGRFARYVLQLSASQAVGAYIELWVTGRDGR